MVAVTVTILMIVPIVGSTIPVDYPDCGINYLQVTIPTNR